MLSRIPIAAFAFACASLTAAVSLHAAPDWKSLQPVVAETCYDCHNTKKAKGGVDLQRLEKDPAIEAEYPLWEKIQEVVAKGDMPPEDETQFSAEEKKLFLGWVGQELNRVAMFNAGDPGPVTLRRLTNAEYNYTIRDLTGIDYGFASDFQADGGGGEGFANTGDTLFISPQQLDKYLTAARKLADHATILPGTGVVFNRSRVGPRGPEQIKDQAQQALYVWYQKASAPHLPKDGEDFREADYMVACWKWKHRDKTGASSLEQLAKEARLSPAFLNNWWTMLNSEQPKSRYLDLTRVPWRQLPGPDAAHPNAVPPAVVAGAQAIQVQRRSWDNPKNPGSGVQRRQQDSDGLHTYPARVAVPKGQRSVSLVVGDIGDGSAGDLVQFSNLAVRRYGKSQGYLSMMRYEREANGKLLKEIESGKPAPKSVTADGLKKFLQEVDQVLARFGHDPLGKGGVKPDALAVQAPAVISLPLPEGVGEVTASGKLDMRSPEVDQATVQWTLTADTPPDPKQILYGVLTVWKRGTPAARETMGDFSRMKAAFPDAFERRLEEVAQNLYRRGPGPGVYYLSDDQLSGLLSAPEQERRRRMREDWDLVAPRKLSNEQQALYDQRMQFHLHSFSNRAWRRLTTEAERVQMSDLYRSGKAKGLDAESAAREVLVRVLVSPHFLYKSELAAVTAAAAKPPINPEGKTAAMPLSGTELATRLSYFLWSSMPDGELRRVAEDGSLLKPEVRVAQVKRMLKDPRAAALAREFAGQWLDFKGFENHMAVDAQKFPEFTAELRRDFAEETQRFFAHLIREDRPVHEIISADYTFLNGRLARHYGIGGVEGDEFKQVSVGSQHRGGLLGQGSVLIKTSRSHRTSPVLRGNWLLQSVLGTPVPPPPSDVPELKEKGPKPATVREMLQQHREAKACSTCHDRIDPLGFALENFDAIGRFRDKDEQGLPLDTSGQVKEAKFVGLEGLRGYLKSQESQFTTQFSRKLLGYALGRQVLPTDKLLIEKMKADMKANEGRLSAAVLAVVESRQFLNRRAE